MPADITQDDFTDLVERMRSSVRMAHRLMAQELLGNVKQFSPVDHGRLAGSWQLETNGLQSKVFTGVEYALVQDQGTGPYDIYPSSAKALRFTVGTRVIYAKHVHHPGIEGKHFVDAAIDRTESRAADLVQQALSAEGLI